MWVGKSNLVPGAFLFGKKARLLQSWTVSWEMSHASPKKNGVEKEANNLEIQPVLNVFSIAFLYEENRAENDLSRLSNSALFLFLCPLKVNY